MRKRIYRVIVGCTLVALVFSVLGISLFAFIQTKKLNEALHLLDEAEAQLSILATPSDSEYWTGYCEGNDVGYRRGYFTAVSEVLTDAYLSSSLHDQYAKAVDNGTADSDFDTWLVKQISAYISGYNDGFEIGSEDAKEGQRFSLSSGRQERTNDSMYISYVGGRVDGYGDGYGNGSYPKG